MSKARRRFTPQEKARILQETKKRGITAAAKKHNIAYSVLYAWKKKSKSADDETLKAIQLKFGTTLKYKKTDTVTKMNSEDYDSSESNYNTNLASEYYVLSLLYRLGFDAYITLGNKKAVDILVKNRDDMTVSIDVKGLKGRTSFPIDNVTETKIKPNHFVIFISFLNNMANISITPEVYVIPSSVIKQIKQRYQGRTVVSLAKLRGVKDHYLNNFEILNGYTSSYDPPVATIPTLDWMNFIRAYNGIRGSAFNLADYEADKLISFNKFFEFQHQFTELFKLSYLECLTAYFKFKPLSQLKPLLENERFNSSFREAATAIFEKRIKNGEICYPDAALTVQLKQPRHPDSHAAFKQWEEYGNRYRLDRIKRIPREALSEYPGPDYSTASRKL